FQQGGPPLLYGARITRSAARSWPIVEAVPPECVWIVTDAEQASSARAIFHVRDVPASDLLAAGLPADAIARAAASDGGVTRRHQERTARDPVSGRAWRSSQPGN